MIEVQGLSRRYGRRLVVDSLSFRVPAGRVTGFLGPNGAGKSTTMRVILGLDRPCAGRALIGGRPYAALGRILKPLPAARRPRGLPERATVLAAKAAVLGVLLLPFMIGSMLPAPLHHAVIALCPTTVLVKVAANDVVDGDLLGPLGPWTSLWLLLGVTSPALVAAAAVLRRRDP